MLASSPPPPVGLPTFKLTDAEFRRLRDFIHAHTGIALSDHKRALVYARLARRLRHHKLESFADYYALLTERDPEGEELVEMINCITTNKTDFFREPHHFRFLKDRLFPEVRARGARRVRIWSAGTASGEEAYTIAMTVREAFPPGELWDIRILATDIDTRVLAHAERGEYTYEQAERIPPALLHKYFEAGDAGRVRAKGALKDLIRFRRLNLMDDPWPMRGPFDAIFCRNVIIYFDRPTQRRLVERFSRLLRPEGYLLLGHSESLVDGGGRLRHMGQSVYQYVGRA
ncbi:MAG TPA: protein-glutamate O-methyltransferase [Burkholderiales bacterium]